MKSSEKIKLLKDLLAEETYKRQSLELRIKALNLRMSKLIRRNLLQRILNILY
jgi:hypothetical protein